MKEILLEFGAPRTQFLSEKESLKIIVARK